MHQAADQRTLLAYTWLLACLCCAPAGISIGVFRGASHKHRAARHWRHEEVVRLSWARCKAERLTSSERQCCHAWLGGYEGRNSKPARAVGHHLEEESPMQKLSSLLWSWAQQDSCFKKKKKWLPRDLFFSSCAPELSKHIGGGLVAKLCPTCDPMDCSLPGSSVHGILQARILEWVAISSTRLMVY